MSFRPHRARLASGLLGLGLLALSGPVPPVAGAAPAPTFLPVALISSPASGRVQALLLGAWQAGRWQPGAGAGKNLPGRPWQAQALGAPSTQRLNSGPALTNEDPCPETVFLDVTLPTRMETQARPLLLTSPGQRTRPRPVEALPTSGTVYREMMRAELQRRGLESPMVNLTSVVRADLDGDGKQEVILAASHFRRGTDAFSPPPSAEAGDYSLVLLRWVGNGEAHTTALAGKVYTKTPTQKDLEEGTMQVPTRYGLAGVADLNADGRMEVVLQDAYYEGDGASVLEWSPQDGAKERLSEGCGA